MPTFVVIIAWHMIPTFATLVQKNPVYKVDTSGAHAGIIVTYKAF